MKLAVMQPYIFPYLGYFQLINVVDNFVFFNDVNYIKKGWINKNNILVNDASYKFTVPVKDASQNKLISEIELSDIAVWYNKFYKTLESSYKKAPNFNAVMGIVENVFNKPCITIDDLATQSVLEVCKYLSIQTKFNFSNKLNYNLEAENGQEKILSICNLLEAKTYINAENGRDLYDKSVFQSNNIQLQFLKMSNVTYKQINKDNFVPSLSIIDVLMFNNEYETKDLLKQFIILP